MKKKVAILSGKTLGKLSRILGYNGTSLPGVIALKIDKNILRKLSKQINQFLNDEHYHMNTSGAYKILFG